MTRNTITIACLAPLALLGGMTAPASAVPVDFLGGNATVTDGPASATFNASLIGDYQLGNFVVAGVDHLFEQRFFIRFDAGPDAGLLDPGNTLSQSTDEISDLLPPLTATADDDTNTFAHTFADRGNSLTASWDLQLTSLSAVSARIDETLTFTNATATDFVLLDLFEYEDWDVGTSGGDDTAVLAPDGTVTVTDPTATVTVLSSPAPDFARVASASTGNVETSNQDAAGNLIVLTGPVGPQDVAAAFQWNDVLLAPGESFTLTKVKSVTVPEPASAALLGLGGLALRARRHSALR